MSLLYHPRTDLDRLGDRLADYDDARANLQELRRAPKLRMELQMRPEVRALEDRSAYCRWLINQGGRNDANSN
jgi:hypothetical protein